MDFSINYWIIKTWTGSQIENVTSVSKNLQIVKDEDDKNSCEETARPRELENMEEKINWAKFVLWT